MDSFDWQADLYEWCRSQRTLPDAWHPDLLKLFSLSFQNTRHPDRAWFGTHRALVSLVLGGIFLAACYRNRRQWVVSILVDQYPPAIDGVQYEPVKSTIGSSHPLLWADAASLVSVKAIIADNRFWASYREATSKITSATQIAGDRDEVQLRRGKRRLSEFWNTPLTGIPPTDDIFGPAAHPHSGIDEVSAMEGRELLRLHRTRERNRKLVARKKRSVLSATGRLACESCEFDFATVYGPRGYGFAECHHIHPISQSASERRTRFSDLAIVCANCHRMLHRRPWMSVAELGELMRLKQNR